MTAKDINIILTAENMANIFNVVIDENNNYMYNLNDNVVINLNDTSSNSFDTYTVKPKDTYHGIAHKFFGTRRLWWVIVKFNNILDPINFPKPGTKLMIPTAYIKNLIVQSIKQ